MLNGLARAVEKKQNFRAAEALLRRALAIQRKEAGASADIAATLTNLGSQATSVRVAGRWSCGT